MTLERRRYEYEASREDERFNQLANLCWGYVPLTECLVFAIEEDGKLIASAEMGQIDGDEFTALLFSASVHPDYRGKGLHRSLIEERVEHAKKMGFRRCVATTYGPDTTSARGLQRCGFRRESWIPSGAAEHQTEWVLDLR